MGYCEPDSYLEGQNLVMDNEVNILAAASNYLFEFEKDLKHLSFDQRRALLSEWEASVKNTLLKKPQRGTLIDSNGRELSAVYGAFYFKRAAGDFRRDTVTVLVGLGPYNIVQQITIHRVQAGIDGEVIRSVCGKKGSEYPISQLVAPLGFTLDAGGAGWTYTVPPSGFLISKEAQPHEPHEAGMAEPGWRRGPIGGGWCGGRSVC